MNEIISFIAFGVIVGIGATVSMDLWALFLRIFKIQSLDYGLLGRWVGHLPQGQYFHQNIARAVPIKAEKIIGWLAHYGIGIFFSFLHLFIFGFQWAASPSLLPALATGLGTLAAPLFILQPAFGLGIAAMKTPRPNIARLKSFAAHLVFGIGLYLSALGCVYLFS